MVFFLYIEVMLQLTYQHYNLPLRYPFTTARYTVNNQPTLIVSISCGEYIGHGEATTNPYYESTLKKLEASIQKVQYRIQDAKTMHPSAVWERLQPLLRNDYFALCAIDCAFWDWYAQKENTPTRRFWSTNDHKTLQTNYTIGIDTPAQMLKKIKGTPWPIYKIKLGTPNDIPLMESITKHSNATFRIDANCGWTAQETLQNTTALQQVGIEFIEQPLPVTQWQEMKTLKKTTTLPLIADESCQREEDVLRCADAFNGINIKLMKCGGITPALRMIQNAKQHGLQVMAGCMTESSVGISALTQLAPLLDYLDADGAMLLQKDIAQGVTFDNGYITYPKRNGSGAVLIK